MTRGQKSDRNKSFLEADWGGQEYFETRSVDLIKKYDFGDSVLCSLWEQRRRPRCDDEATPKVGEKKLLKGTEKMRIFRSDK